MPEEAFALSPISARPSLPSEADYDAIREAFMETARGRWFLSEYAKRNRNADTRMVLDAVERIEQNLTSQKQSASNGLVDALGAISALISETKTIVAQALPDPAETLTGARNGARVTREVAAALRQCGADVRICDLLEAQVDAIDAGHQQLALIAPRHAVLAAFDRLLQGVVDLASGNDAATEPTATSAEPPRADAPPPAAPPVAPQSFATVQPEAAGIDFDLEFTDPSEAAMPATVTESVRDEAVAAETEAHDLEPTDDVAAFASATSERAPYEADAAMAPFEPSLPTLEQIAADEAALDAEAAYDISVLDMVAQEMSALDDDMAEFDPPEPPAAEPLAAAPSASMVAAESEPVELTEAYPIELDQVPAAAETSIAPTAMPAAPIAEAAPPAVSVVPPTTASVPSTRTASPPAAPASLGAAVLAHGMVRKPAPNSDPLAALRRMTQAEKLAFFS
uniref:Putative CheA signal transduction histidine kinases n=1 Tax=Rhodopseudomonas palustris (strain BisA53) TaxID=316055 RepID=Q07RL6_RHOP5